MKSLFSILFIFILSGNFLFAQFGPFGGGDGTESNPFQIYSKAHLEELQDSIIMSPVNTGTTNFSNGKYFILMNDITDSMRTVIGTRHINSGQDNTFQGNFDGQGYKITLALNPTFGANVERSGGGYGGLFGAVSGNVEIKNLIVDGYIIGTVSGSVGGIVGVFMAQGTGFSWMPDEGNLTIKNCINMANISVRGHSQTYGPYAGGIIGGTNYVNTIIIEDCINIGNIETISQIIINGRSAGILAGGHKNILINRCINAGYIKGNTAGGITVEYKNFMNNDFNITNSINIGIVDGYQGRTGAIVGEY